jgi:hypothetical protein
VSLGRHRRRRRPARAAGLATAFVLGGFGFLTVAEAGGAYAISVAVLFAAIALGVAAAAPGLLEDEAGWGSLRARRSAAGQ